jgi:hypothetical protein
MQFKTIITTAVIGATLSLSGCTRAPELIPQSVSTTVYPMPNSNADIATCPAKDLQYLVGQSRTVLFTMRFGTEVRFEEPGQAYTQDFKPTRTRIIIGAEGKIARIVCG